MKRCGLCGEEKPEADFAMCSRRSRSDPRSVKRWRRGTCKPCERKRCDEWRSAHPDAVKTYRRRTQAKVQAARAIFATLPQQNVDVLRRVLAEAPSDLQGETEAAAYFRGYIAGAKRSGAESERFERLKDLAHRIAADFRREARTFVGYEDRLSFAYEGLLNFIRKRRPEGLDLIAERKLAAGAIRHAIMDALRREGEFGRSGVRNPSPEGFLGLGEDAEMPSSLVLATQNSQDAPGADFYDLLAGVSSGRSRAILEHLAKGETLKEAGAAFGVSESRASQLVREVREMNPGLERRLLEAV